MEQSLSGFRSEIQSLIADRVTIDTFNARMETQRQAVEGLRERVAANETRTQSMEDERDRTRLALAVAIITALLAPIVVALLLRGIS